MTMYPPTPFPWLQPDPLADFVAAVVADAAEREPSLAGLELPADRCGAWLDDLETFVFG
jgi:hypothetical protein